MQTPDRDPAFERTRTLLSTLWIFAMFNYLYADVMGLMDASLLRQYLTGRVQSLHITPGFLLAAAVLMEIPIAMTLLSRVLPHRANRWANIVAGGLKTVVVFMTFFVGSTTLYYAFFSSIEIVCTAAIVVIAWRWKSAETRSDISSRAMAETQVA